MFAAIIIAALSITSTKGEYEEIVPIQRSYSVSNTIYPNNADKRAPENLVDVVASTRNESLFISSDGKLFSGNDFEPIRIMNESGHEIEHLPPSKLMFWDENSVFVAHSQGVAIMNCQCQTFRCILESTTPNKHFGGINDISISNNNTAWIATESGLWSFSLSDHSLIHILNTTNLKAIDVDDDRGFVFVGGNDKFYILNSKERQVTRWEWVSNVETGQGGVINDVITSLCVVPSNRTLYIGTRLGITILDLDSYTFMNLDRGVLPFSNVTSLTYDSSYDRLWIGTTKGLVIWNPRKSSTKFLNSTRWLAGSSSAVVNQVIVRENLAVVVKPNDGVTWLQTQNNWTLHSKATHYERILRTRHGLVTSCVLRHYGTLENCTRTDSDNDGLWTSIVLVAELFRMHSVTSESEKEDARQRSSTFLQGMLTLNRITGKKGFMARSVCSQSEWEQRTCGGSKDTHDLEHWQVSTVQDYAGWRWKDDTSSDEVVGHVFALLISSVLSHSSRDRDDARTALISIVHGIVQNDYELVGTNNQSTTWGKWTPTYVNNDRNFSDERGLQSLQILAFLSAATNVSSSSPSSPVSPSIFRNAFLELTNETNQYDENMINLKIQTPSDDNFSDDELSFLPLFTILFSGKSSLVARNIFEKTLSRTFAIVRSERSSLWTTIYLIASKVYDFVVDFESLRRDIEWNLQTWPLEHINWHVDNSNREDIMYESGSNRFDVKHTDSIHSHSPIPANERNQYRWNANPFDISAGGDGMSQLDPGAYLLTYWMARYYNILGESA